MKLTVEMGARSYTVVLKRGALRHASQLGNLKRKVLLLSDEGVPEKYIKTILQQCGDGHLLVLQQGESHKTIQTVQRVLSKMIALSLGRADAVAALGGGAVGDIGCYAAASYMGGIPLFQFPTTTASQAEASIGGRASLNLDGVKGISQVTHQPELVIADPDTLKTLPPRNFASGLAEAMKLGLIASGELFELLEHEEIEENLETILYLSLRCKKDIVEADETGEKEGKLLNFGRTIGYAVESAGGLKELLDGECLALGMLPMIETRSLRRRAKNLMKKLGLPVKHKYAPEDLLQFVRYSSDRGGEEYTVVQVRKTGHAYLETMDSEEMELLIKGEEI